MAQFFGLVPLNASNFESGNASEGQVLTADGSGGASWEAAGGGGGGATTFTISIVDGLPANWSDDSVWELIMTALNLSSNDQASNISMVVTFQGVEHPEYLLTLSRSYVEGWGIGYMQYNSSTPSIAEGTYNILSVYMSWN